MGRRDVERRRRFERLREFDRAFDPAAWAAGRLAGVDEAGVGPLAGPVVAAAVVLPPEFELPELFDSKQMTASERLRCARAVRDAALAFGITRVSPQRIDRINIRRAMFVAHRQALAKLSIVPDVVLVDGRWLGKLPAGFQGARATAVVKGDTLSLAIAAASVLAKVARDRLLVRLDREFPQYGFARHKGYSTAEHMQALRDHGLSAVHRRSFCGFLEHEKLLARQGQLALEP